MTDPVFALEPDDAAATWLALLAAFRLLSGTSAKARLRVREGADSFILATPLPVLRAEARTVIAGGDTGVRWDRRQLGGGRGPDGRRSESHQLTALAVDPRAQRRGARRLERGFRPLGKPAACLRHWTCLCKHSARQERTSPPITTSATEFYASHFWMSDLLLLQRALFTDDQQDLTQAQRPRWRACATSWRLHSGDHLLEIGTWLGRCCTYAARHCWLPGHHHHPFREQHRCGYCRAHAARAGLAGSRRGAALPTTAIWRGESTTNWCRWR